MAPFQPLPAPCARLPMCPSSADPIVQRLIQPQASIDPKYFYDTRGSQLFEAITQLPEYYLTRTEQAIWRAHGAEIARCVGAGAVVIEPGAGNCDKAREVCRSLRPQAYVAVDIAADFLQRAALQLREACPGVSVWPVVADIQQGFALPPELPAGPRWVFYPGSSLGNFEPGQALELLRFFRGLAGPDGGLLLGVDLPKPRAVLEAAYDDAQGVTAAFNRNVLAHLNRRLQADFDPGQWAHRAHFNAEQHRVEMHLEALQPQRVRWPGGGREFAAGERIHTENSYKLPLEQRRAQLAEAGFADATAWLDPLGWFAVLAARSTPAQAQPHGGA